MALGVGPGTGPSGLAAQPAQESGAELSFEAAVREALDRNPVFQQQLNAVLAAEHAERESFGAAFLPSLSASLGFNGTTFRRQTAEDDFGRPIGGAEVIETTTSSTSQGVGGRFTLFDLSRWRGWGEARARTAAEAAGVDLSAAQLRTRVGQAYWEATRTQRIIDVEEGQLGSARRQLAAVRELLRVAARQPTDVLGAELQVAQAEQSLQRAVGDARKARLQLKEVMGVDLDRRYELTSGLPAVFDPAGLDVGRLIARAVGQGPRIGQEAARVESARRAVSAARAARYPTVSGSMSWGRSTSAPDYDAIGELDPPNQSWGFGFDVSLPLFTRFSTSAQIGRAEARLDDARQMRRAARLQVEREVRSALIDLESAYAGVRLAEQSAGIARSRLAQGQELYRLGSLRYTDLQRMFDDVASAERDVVNARAQFAGALLQLEEKLGGPLDTPGP